VTAQRTYWHLEGLERKPSDYEIVTSKLLYYPERGFEVITPIDRWYRRYQQQSALRLGDWDRFCDPRQTTYRKYTELAKNRETYVDGLLASIEETQADRELSPACLGLLEDVLPVLRFPVHGLQMLAAYVGQMAPGGRVVLTCLFQSADEIRRIQRIAYRMRQLQAVKPDFGAASRTAWENDARWQPLRELIERLLVTYDWSEAFVALTLALKPAFDDVFMVRYGEVLGASGEATQPKILRSLYDDCRWHRAWATALAGTLATHDAANAAFMTQAFDRWRAPIADALGAVEPVIGGGEVEPIRVRVDRIHERLRRELESAGVSAAEPGVAP
jgi:toluene monooxygenase system protein E